MSISPNLLFKLFVLTLCGFSNNLYSQDTPADIVTDSLDDVDGVPWIVEKSDGVTIERVAMEDAVGGSALKVTVPSVDRIELMRFTQVSSVYGFRLMIQSDVLVSGKQLTWTSSSGIGKLNGTEGLDGWLAYREQFLGHPSGYISWRVERDYSESVADRVFLLDGFTVDSGVLVRLSAAEAVASVQPEKEIYQVGEWISLDMEPSGDANTFGSWSVVGSSETFEKSFDWKIEGQSEFRVEGARRFDFEQLSVVVPLGRFELLSFTSDGNEHRFSLGKADPIWGETIRVSIPYSGFLVFEGRGLSEGLDRVQGGVFGEDFSPHRIWVDEDLKQLDLWIGGSVELQGFRMEKGYPIDIEVEGEGQVEGLDSGIGIPGEPVQLRAIASEGWRFVSWEGDIKSSDPALEFVGESPLNLRAIFEHVVLFDGIEFRNRGDLVWTISDDGDRELLLAPSVEPIDSFGELRFEVDGPGVLSIEFEASEGGIAVYRSPYSVSDPRSLAVAYLDKYTYAISGGRLEIDLLSGSNCLSLVSTGSSREVESNDVSILDFDVERGHLVEVVAGIGGSVVDAPNGRFAFGTILELQTVPNEGFQFEKWTGDFVDKREKLSIPVEGDISLRAEFSRLLDDGSSRRLGGPAHWLEVDGKWTTPENLEAGDVSWFEFPVKGPARLTFKWGNSFHRGLFARYDGGEWETVYRANWTRLVGEGDHLIRFEAVGGSITVPTSLESLDIEYEIELEAINGLVEVSPEIGFGGIREWQKGYVLEGTEITFSADGLDAAGFVEWKGDLSGYSSSGTVVVDSSIRASAYFASESIRNDGIDWVFNDDGVYAHTLVGDLYVSPSGLTDLSTVSAEIGGPGTLRAHLGKVDGHLVFSIGGDLVEMDEDGFMDIPSGIHSLDIDISWFGDEGEVDVAPFYLEYNQGYHLGFWSELGGGVLVSNLIRNEYYTSGTTFSMKAETPPYNRFVKWEGDIDSFEPELELTLNRDLSVEAVFEAENLIGDRLWEFEGIKPIYIEKAASPIVYGDLEWNYGEEDRGKTGIARTVVKGPTLFRHGIAEPGKVMLFVDGQIVEFSRERMNLLPGDHEIEYRFEVASLLDATGKTYGNISISTPEILDNYRVYFKGRGTDLDIKSAYAPYGERLVVEAPELNSFGEQFQAWWWSGREFSGERPYESGRLVTFDRKIDYQIEEEGTFLALYAPGEIRADGLAFHNTLGSWTLDSGNLLPSGERSIRPVELNQNSFGLRVVSSEDCTLHFWVKLEGAALDGEFVGEWPNETAWFGRGYKEWHEVAVPLKATEVLEIRSHSFSGDQTCFIGGFKASPGWLPHLLGVNKLDVSRLENSVVLNPKNEYKDEFIGWTIFGEDGRPVEVDTASIEIGIGGHVRVDSVFSLKDDAAFATLQMWPDYLWNTNSDSNPNELGYVFRSGAQGSLASTFTGPSVFSFELSYYFETKVYIDGAEVEDETQWGRHYIEVPEGEHFVEVVFEGEPGGAELLVGGIQFTEGRLFEDQEFAGGEVHWESDGPVLIDGRTYAVLATPALGYRFVGWNAPYADQARRFEIVADASALPVPLFEEIEIVDGFQIRQAGRDWTYGGLTFETIPGWLSSEDVVFSRKHSKLTGNETAWFKSEISGPGKLVFWKLDGISYVVDGEPIGDQYLEENSSYRLFLEKGAHELKIIILEDGIFLDVLDQVRWEPGYCVDAQLLGVVGELSSGSSMFAEGAVATLSLTGVEDASILDWSGLPEDSVFVGNKVSFNVFGHVRLKGMLWRSKPLLGFDFRYAGSSQWNVSSEGIVESPGLDPGDKNFLELLPDGIEMIKVKFRLPRSVSSGSLLNSELKLGGVMYPMSYYDSGSDLILEAVVDLRWNEGKVQFSFENESSFLNQRTYDIQILDIEILDVDSLGPFETWWFDHVQGNILTYRRALYQDGDRDGIGALDEFLLGTNPWSSDGLFGIELDRGGEGLELVRQSEVDSLVSRAKLEVSFSLGADAAWLDPEEVFGQPRVDLETGESRWSIGSDWTELYLRLKAGEGQVDPQILFGSASSG